MEGPVMIFLTTTAIKIDEELLNRCLVLSVDENREQTRAIHQFQRRRQTLAGLLADQDRKETLTLHRNAQRLLRPLLVANPFAESLDVPGRQDPHPPGPREIPDADPGHRPAAPIPAARSRRPCINDQTVEYIEVTLGRHRRGQPAGLRSAWAGRWTNCRRRPAGCWASWTKWSRPPASGWASTGPTTVSAAGTSASSPAGAIRNSRST